MWLIYAVSAAAVWGLDYALGERLLKNKISPISLLALQMAFGSVFFIVAGYRTSIRQDIVKIFSDRQMIFLTLSTLMSFSLGNWLIFLSIQEKSATVAGLIELCYPVFTLLFVYLLFNENQLTLGVLIGSFFIFSGVIVIALFS